MSLVMFAKDKQARAGVIDGEDIVDINAADRSLPQKPIPFYVPRSPRPASKWQRSAA